MGEVAGSVTHCLARTQPTSSAEERAHSLKEKIEPRKSNQCGAPEQRVRRVAEYTSGSETYPGSSKRETQRVPVPKKHEGVNPLSSI